MPRVIQDSDDEGDLGEVSPLRGGCDKDNSRLEMAPPPPATLDVSTVPSVFGTTNGTSSSEKIRRELQEAHNAMFEPSPSTGKRPRTNEIDTVPSVSSPDTSRLKRTKTAAASTSDSPNSLSPSTKKKLTRTYSKRTPNTLENDIFDVPISPLPSEKKNKRPEASHLQDGTPDDAGKASILHTVAPLDIHYKPPQPSPLNSSQFISPATMSEPFTNDNSQQLPETNEMGAGFESHDPNVMFPDMSSTMVDSSSILDARINPSVSDHPELTGSGERRVAEVQDQSSGSTWSAHVEVIAENATGTSLEHSSEKLPADVHIQEELVGPSSAAKAMSDNLKAAKAPSSEAKSTKKKRKAPPEADHSQPHSDDLVGLPKEQYKPRPSRSRSARISHEEAIASSETGLEKSQRLKRRRTTGGISADTTQALVEMGFRASQAEEALIETDWIMEKAIDLLTARYKSKSPEAVRSVAKVEEQVGEQNLSTPDIPTHDVTVVIENQTAQDRNAISRDSAMPDIATLEKELQKDNNKTMDELRNGESTANNREHQPKLSSDAQNVTSQQPKFAHDDAKAESKAQADAMHLTSPSSNTKIKRTKSIKPRKQQKTQIAADDLQEDELSRIQDFSMKDQHGIEEQNPSKPLMPIQDGTVNLQEEQKIDSALPKSLATPKEDLASVKQTQGHANHDQEVVEIDDDSDGYVQAAKLRRTKTAPAKSLEKKKKRRGRPKKSEQPAAQENAKDQQKTDATPVNSAADTQTLPETDKQRQVLPLVENNKDRGDVPNGKDQLGDVDDAAKAVTVRATKKNKQVKTTIPQEPPEPGGTNIPAGGLAEQTTPNTGHNPDGTTHKTPDNATSHPEKENDLALQPTETTSKVSESKNNKKQPQAHSPIKKAGVAFRVGLSKHSRIEPLLKIKRR